MVFWKTYPFKYIIKSKLNKSKFLSLVFNKPTLLSPTRTNAKILNTNNYNYKYLSELRQFIRKYFGNPPKTPILDISEENLINEKDHILFLRDTDNNIVGCIRYHYLGIFISSNNQPIYCVDCFCIHPKWRKKGLGDYLLTELHNYVNKQTIPFSLFLKEGSRLNIFHTPLLTGIYAYKKTIKSECQNIRTLTKHDAYKLMNLFFEFNKNIFIVRNFNSNNQIWKLYKNGINKILVCFQDTFQIFYENEKQNKIGWITAWFESPNLPESIREHASINLADSMFNEYDYIWTNREWVGNSIIWKCDGLFHWYSHQWSTNINLKGSYCIQT